jgi:hypothetical protein
MDLLNEYIAGAYAGDCWKLDIYVDVKTLAISAEILINDESFVEATVQDPVELEIWLWNLGIVGKEIDKLVNEVEGAQLFCASCS